MNVIEIHGLTKTYGGMRAVDGLEMRVGQGDIYGFVGKNGAGKSTTMKIIAGLVAPTAGSVELFARSPYDPAAARPARPAGAHASTIGTPSPSSFSSDPSRIGVLIEEPGVIPNFSAAENLMVKALGMGVIHPREHCRELLELVGLDPTSPRKVKKFSMGMKQRLGLALALVGSPDLLLLDEPFNGMDPEATRDLRGALMRLNHERGVTMVISSHVLDQLNRMATRFGVIRAGQMVREFSGEELHAACGSSVRVKTADPSRTLAILEERLPGATFRAEPDGAIVVAGAAGQRAAAASFGGAADDAHASGTPTAEDISRILHDADQLVLELSVLERDIEDYFVELMGTDDEDAERTARTGNGSPAAPRIGRSHG